ncbi:hypothetical protein PIIN_01930 [Serendipita indica DSM 11827]|uniref:Uncharacterized protein n=1 Tax=Serendipita indica (strain DSM 11827) TaxID=1109443 RepID=G4T9S0_SERID|nr:hypothetical protein PIIN_01930 [Serendipita indica DSM 11827]
MGLESECVFLTYSSIYMRPPRFCTESGHGKESHWHEGRKSLDEMMSRRPLTVKGSSRDRYKSFDSLPSFQYHPTHFITVQDISLIHSSASGPMRPLDVLIQEEYTTCIDPFRSPMLVQAYWHGDVSSPSN